MNRHLKWIWQVSVLLGAVMMGSFLIGTRKTAPAYSCVAGPDEQCPSDEWVKEYREWKTLQDKYSAPKDVQIKLRGYQVDLGSQVPVGYDVNEKNPMNPRFVKQKPPIAAQAPGK